MMGEALYEEGFVSLPVAAAAVTAVVLLALFGMMYRRRHGSLMKSDQVIEEAERSGRTVEARLAKSRYMCADTTERWARKRRHHWVASYEYVADGKIYSYRRVFDSQPPETLTLYYAEDNPGHAYSRGDREPGGTFALFFAVSIIVMIIFLRIIF